MARIKIYDGSNWIEMAKKGDIPSFAGSGSASTMARSDHTHSQYLTSHQDISGKLDNYGSTVSRPNGTNFTFSTGSNPIQLRSKATSGSDIGIFYLSDDNAFICNSSDSGYNFAVFDTDVTNDFSVINNAEFAVVGAGNGCRIRGNTVLHSGNIKTVNGQSLVGSGNITISGGSVSGVPYTGATADVNLGEHSITAEAFYYRSEMFPASITFYEGDMNVTNSGPINLSSQYSTVNYNGYELATVNTVSQNQTCTTVVKNATTNISGKSLSAYTAQSTTITSGGVSYSVIKILKNSAILSEEDAKSYMASQTGSYFLPVYDYDHPTNTYFIFGDGRIYKVQYDSTNGLVLWYMNQLAYAGASVAWSNITGKPSFATVATSGSYNDLSNKPTIPSAVTESTVSGWGFTKNTGTVTSVNGVSPTNGNVSITIPTVPTNVSAFANDSGYITSSGSCASATSATTATTATKLSYTTTAPTSANNSGLKVAVLSSEPSTKYAGWLYIITD